VIEAMATVFRTFPSIAVVYLFGSRVYGKTVKARDYDVAVLFKDDDYGLDELLNVTLIWIL